MDRPREDARRPDRPASTRIVLSAIGLSWLGLLIHNLAELGGGVLLGPETLAPTGVYVLLAAGWLTTRIRRTSAWLLLAWGSLQLVGGGLLSVLPLGIWPYEPEQSLLHYAFHAVYAALQAPLLLTVSRYLRHAPTPAGSGPGSSSPS